VRRDHGRENRRLGGWDDAVARVVGRHGGNYTGKMARKTSQRKTVQQSLKAARKGKAAHLKNTRAQAKADQ